MGEFRELRRRLYVPRVGVTFMSAKSRDTHNWEWGFAKSAKVSSPAVHSQRCISSTQFIRVIWIWRALCAILLMSKYNLHVEFRHVSSHVRLPWGKNQIKIKNTPRTPRGALWNTCIMHQHRFHIDAIIHMKPTNKGNGACQTEDWVMRCWLIISWVIGEMLILH